MKDNENVKKNKVLFVKGHRDSYSTRVSIPITWLREDLGIEKDVHEHVRVIRDQENKRIILEPIEENELDSL
jgi:hypothetical protein